MKTGKRIFIWIIVLTMSIFGAVTENHKSKPVQETTAYISSEFKENYDEIEKSFNKHKLGYSLKVSDKKNGDDSFVITTDIDEISSEDYEVIGETPLIVVLKQNKKLLKSYNEKGLLACSGKMKIDEDDEVEIQFKKIMEAVLKNEKWIKFGGKDKEIKVFYPEPSTVEGKLFKHFLLITANDGSYPTTQEQMQKAQEQVEEFLANPNVQAVNIMNRLAGVNDIGSDLYVTFENDVMQLDKDKYKDKLYITYPRETVVKQIFFESKSEIGDKTQKILGEDPTILSLSMEYRICEEYTKYRYERRKNIKEYRGSGGVGIWDKVNFKDNYNYIEIPRNQLLSTDLTTTIP